MILAGCGSKEPTAPAPTASASGAGATAAQATPSESWTTLFGEKAPTLPAPFSKLTAGMNEAEAQAQLPGGNLSGPMPDLGGVRYTVTFGFERQLAGVSFEGDAPGSLAALEARWGKGYPTSAFGEDARVWAEPATGLRAIWYPSMNGQRATLVIGPYLPVEDVLPVKDGSPLGRASALLGKPAAEIASAFPNAKDVFNDGKRLSVKGPPTLGAMIGHQDDFDLHVAGGVVAMITLTLDLPEGARAGVFALARERLGAPIDDEGIGGATLHSFCVPGAGLRYTLEEPKAPDADDIAVVIERYVPIESLIGVAPGRFGFETTPIIGRKLADLRTQYPSLSAASDDGSLLLPSPPTEAGPAEIQISVTEDGTAAFVGLEVYYGTTPAYRTRIEALLEKRFGVKPDFQAQPKNDEKPNLPSVWTVRDEPPAEGGALPGIPRQIKVYDYAVFSKLKVAVLAVLAE